MRVLREYRARQNAERLQWGEAWVNTGLVFARENGSALRPDYVTHLFQTLVRTAGLPRIRLHDLRHTHATLALAAGVELKTVSARLGHSSIGITADPYTKVVPAVAREAANKIASQVPRHGSAAPPAEYCASTAHDGPELEQERRRGT